MKFIIYESFEAFKKATSSDLEEAHLVAYKEACSPWFRIAKDRNGIYDRDSIVGEEAIARIVKDTIAVL